MHWAPKLLVITPATGLVVRYVGRGEQGISQSEDKENLGAYKAELEQYRLYGNEGPPPPRRIPPGGRPEGGGAPAAMAA